MELSYFFPGPRFPGCNGSREAPFAQILPQFLVQAFEPQLHALPKLLGPSQEQSNLLVGVMPFLADRTSGAKPPKETTTQICKDPASWEIFYGASKPSSLSAVCRPALTLGNSWFLIFAWAAILLATPGLFHSSPHSRLANIFGSNLEFSCAPRDATEKRHSREQGTLPCIPSILRAERRRAVFCEGTLWPLGDLQHPKGNLGNYGLAWRRAGGEFPQLS